MLMSKARVSARGSEMGTALVFQRISKELQVLEQRE